MELQKNIKSSFITIFVISVTAIGYATVTTVTTGTPLTATMWNDMKAVVDDNTSNLIGISNLGGKVGIGTTTPLSKLEVNDIAGITRIGANTANNGPGILLTDPSNTYAEIKMHMYNGVITQPITFRGSNYGFELQRFTDAVGTAVDNGVNSMGFNIGFPSQNMLGSKSLIVNGMVGIGTSNPSYTLHVNGTAGGPGAWTNYSDERFKKNIKKINNSLEKINSIEGVYFDWKNEEFKNIKFQEGRDLGVIAQDIESIFPEVITTDSDGYKSVAYSKLVAPLIEAVKELSKQNEELKNRIELLENK